MTGLVLDILGMSCAHCLKTVNQALSAVPGVRVQSVQIGRALVEYDSARTDPGAVAAAVVKAGYSVKTARDQP